MPIGYVYVGPQGDLNQVFVNLVTQINAEFADINAYPPGGADTQVQYNHQGSFDGVPGMVWSGTDLTLPPIAAPGITFSNGQVQGRAILGRTDAVTPFITAIGSGALSRATGAGNVAVGYLAGTAQTTAINNVLIGYLAGTSVTSGNSITAVGSNVLGSATAGVGNTTAVGTSALSSVTSGSSGNNTAVGFDALLGLTTGSQATAIGYGAGYFSGTAVAGQSSTNKVTTGAYGTYVGFQAAPGSTTARNYQTVLGAGAVGYDAANTVTLGLIGTDTPYMGPAVVGMATVTTYYTVSSLPVASAALKGARAYVTDAAAVPVFGAAATGGGSLGLPVFCDGTTWLNG